MKALLLAAASAIGLAAAAISAPTAAARVDFDIEIGPIFDDGHDRCYDYWFREEHPRYCYWRGHNEWWWRHHHRRHHRDWDDRHHDRDHDHDHHHDHDHDHHDHDHDHHDHDHHHHHDH